MKAPPGAQLEGHEPRFPDLQALGFPPVHRGEPNPTFPGGAGGKESTCQYRRPKRHRFDPWVGKIPWRRPWQPIPAFLPGESHGQRSLVGYNPWGHKESDTYTQTYSEL